MARRVRARSPGRTLRRQVSREVHAITALAMLGLLLPILLFDLTTLVDLLANRGLPASLVAGLVGLRVVPALAIAVAPAVLLAVIATLARMRAHQELLALEGSGVALVRLARPILGAALLWSLIAAALTLEGAPATHRRANAWLAEAALANPTAILKSGQVQAFANLRVHAREVSPDGSRLSGVTVWLPSIETTAFARRARVVHFAGAPPVVRLEAGRVLVPAGEGMARIDFESFEENLVPPAPEQVEDALGASAGRALLEAVRGGDDDRATHLELQRRVASAASTLTLACLAIAVGLSGLARSRSGALVAGAAALPLYYGLVQLGEGLARNPDLPPPVVWVPHALVLAAALALGRWGSGGAGIRRGGRARARSKRLRPKRFALDRDAAWRFLEFVALCTVAGVVVGALIDVLDNLKWFTQYRAELGEIANFYGARIPILFSRVFPLALTTAAGLAMGSAAAAGELTAARACGIGPLRTVAPIVFACLLAAAAQNVLANVWVPRFSALASEIKQLEIKNRSRVQYGTWRHRGDSLFEIGTLDPIRGVADDIVYYELAADGLPVSRTEAVSARHLGDGQWLLDGARRFSAEGAGFATPERPDAARWGEDLVTSIDTGDLTLEDLEREIERARRDGYDPRSFLVDLYARLAAPFTCVVLPFLVLLYATRGPPFPATSRIAVVGLVLALVHGVAAGLSASFGYSGALPPVVAGWLPLGGLAAGGVVFASLRR